MSQSQSQIVVPSGATSGMNVSLHPLAILNISDHYTRSKIVASPVSPKLIGALLGTQSGRDVSIVNSFELVYVPEESENGLVVDLEFWGTRKDQFSQVFPALNIVGWYTIGESPTLQDVLIHQQMTAANEASPTIFVLFNPDIPHGSQQLPFTVFESALSEGGQNIEKDGKLVQLDCGIETGEAERIAVDGVAKDSSGENDPSGRVGSLTTQRNAIMMLYQRVLVLVRYASAVLEGSATADHHILRQIASVTATLPVMTAEKFRVELQTDFDDGQVLRHLTTLLRELEALTDYTDKHNALHPLRSDDRGAKGFGLGGIGEMSAFGMGGSIAGIGNNGGGQRRGGSRRR